MSTDTETPTYTKSALEFKSTSFSVPILIIFNAELVQLEHQIEQKIAQAPEFFKNSPIFIDLQTCNHQQQKVDLSALIKCLQNKKLFPIGICGGNKQQNKLALKLNIPSHTIRENSATTIDASLKLNTIDIEKSDKNSSSEITPSVENMLITQPIRSGQRVYAKGDLTILSHVSAGAEVMAEGNIHVYGTLRGRALAGVQGNIDSRIFCSKLHAELVSIDGHYKINGEIDKEISSNPAQIYLQDQKLIIKNL
ncbi:MAG: septum site-determining protein MinC [Methylococcales symbiont of Hymedesmia sp. n. MRB-2018]|nr:MAG: septum site-determining protein MinC [Methylococcales symbiont of Hymedesmia sp. n. MRB-2018]KAF3984610.1 MAG: septum site-determining protein MinC [Methylococcales symbiont of Hymedesmia sp. n. MRB-2018]